MALNKVTYVHEETTISAQNLNDIQDEIIANLEKITTNQNEITSHSNSTAHITEQERTTWDTAVTTADTANTTANEALEKANASATTKTYTVSVSNTAWTEDTINGGYVCTLSVSDILSTDTPIADIVLGTDIDANTLYIEAWALVTRIETAENSITLYANNGAPATAFTMQLKVVR